ncbi:tripartite tricarboxylate transporter substrate-binding protein [Planococcus sp. N064]|uniref:Tripartite tricarboxylate transporter substrate-binding protein n=1 Tax=Planococcus liqunii TaxID=3058394 RepID=A0ABT8MSR3_9BACL|nr:tripartite tricarboxylate transporter substrate-binding protein [Planococcus sp. N064]MDN7227940.1 tripartite tricarboxylate transporter substrate-binding protein [Planococcus sp. N064]
MRRKCIIISALIAILLAGCSQEEPDISLDEVTLVAGSIGGGWDITAQMIQDSLLSENLIDGEIHVVNHPGAGGELGWKYTQQQKGPVLAINSSLLITNHLLGQSQLTYKDFTPLAILATEWEVVVVSKDSSIKSANSLIESLKGAPQNFKIGVSPRLGNDDQLSFVLASKQAGAEPEELDFLIYENSAQVVEALLEKQIDVASMTLSEAKKYYDLDQVKILVISSDKRLKELPEIPTWTEEGIEVVFEHWRGIMGPPNMSKDEIQFWDETFGQMVQSEQWQQTTEQYMWKDFYMNSSETTEFLEKQSKMYEELMKASGK